MKTPRSGPPIEAIERAVDQLLSDTEGETQDRLPPESACPLCGALPGNYLGTLGDTVHLRCSNCGWTYHITA
jgi:rubredoxin